MLHRLFQSANHAAPYMRYHRVPGDSTGGSSANTGDPVFWLRSVATIRLGIAPTFAKHLSLATGCTKTCAEVGDLHSGDAAPRSFERKGSLPALAIHVCLNAQRGFDIKDIDLPPSSTLSRAQQGGTLLPFRLETRYVHVSLRGVPLLVKRDDPSIILTSAPYSFLSHLLSAMVTL